MDIWLQWIGGVFYLLQKILLSLAERANLRGDRRAEKQLRIVSWIAYMIGLPPWVIIFISWRNWIAAVVEASGLPAMVLGLVIAWKGSEERSPTWLRVFAWACAGIGLVVSLVDLGGLTRFTQGLEIALVAGFLIGTIELARQRTSGYLWYVLMHVSCGWLMWIQGYPWLFVQQLVSLIFIADAYAMTRRRAFLIQPV